MGAAPPERDPTTVRVRPHRRVPVENRRRTGRATGIVLAVFLTAVAVLLGSGVWAYSGQIAKDVLLVRHYGGGPFRGDLVVGSVGDGHVTLRPDHYWQTDPLRTADVYGLMWADGGGVVSGEPALQPDGEVVRALK